MKLRRVLLIMAGVAVAALGYSSWSLAAPALRTELPGDKFELTLSADKTVYQIGEYPKVTATLTNRLARTVLPVRALLNICKDAAAYRNVDVAAFL